MPIQRTQLTLFVRESEAAAIEQIRQAFNPVQYALIKCHVTLCREDELVPLETVLQQLAVLQYPAFTLPFGAPVRFDEGRGILLPAEDDCHAFHQLRAMLLQDITAQPRRHEPHLTLLHPRNATCTDAIFEQVQQAPLPRLLHFDRISLIEQSDGGPWVILQESALGNE